MIGRLRPGVDAAAATSELRAINRRIFPIWKSSYQDDKATWSLMDLKERAGGQRQDHRRARARGGGAGLVDRLRQRVELAHRAGVEPAAGAGGAGRTGGVATAGRAPPARGKRAAGQRCRGDWLGAGMGWRRPSARCRRRLLPATEEIAIDGPVLAVLLAVTWSARDLRAHPGTLRLGRDVDQTLHASERASTGSPTARRLRRGLVATQFAISTPLLVVAALLLVSLNERRKVDLGFDGANLVSGSIRLPGALYQQEGSITSYWDELSRRLAALPGDRRSHLPTAGRRTMRTTPTTSISRTFRRRLASPSRQPRGSLSRRSFSAFSVSDSSRVGCSRSVTASRRTFSRWSSIARGRNASSPTEARSASGFARAAAPTAPGRRWWASSAM